MEQINWICKYCSNNFSFKSKRQIGGHLTNCKLNPKRFERLEKISESLRTDRINLSQNCPRCNKVFHVILTEADFKNKKYRKYCDKICANATKASEALKLKQERLKVSELFLDLSVEQRAVELRKKGLSILDISRLIGINKKEISKLIKDIKPDNPEDLKRFTSNGFEFAAKSNKLKRQERDKENLAEADKLFLSYKFDPLFVLGLGLYWGEGGKTERHLNISNSDPGILIKWIEWHKKFAQGMEIIPTIYGHADVVFEDAKKYWSEKLGLSLESFRWVSSQPISSKSKRPKRILPYGTVRLHTSRGSTEMFIKMMRWIDLMSITKFD